MATTKKADETTILSVIQDLFIFQMATAGVPQDEIRRTVRLDANRVSRIAKLVKQNKTKS
jgi:hypothetical protein